MCEPRLWVWVESLEWEQNGIEQDGTEQNELE